MFRFHSRSLNSQPGLPLVSRPFPLDSLVIATQERAAAGLCDDGAVYIGPYSRALFDGKHMDRPNRLSWLDASSYLSPGFLWWLVQGSAESCLAAHSEHDPACRR
jgi:hypothetical protein